MCSRWSRIWYVCWQILRRARLSCSKDEEDIFLFFIVLNIPNTYLLITLIPEFQKTRKSKSSLYIFLDSQFPSVLWWDQLSILSMWTVFEFPWKQKGSLSPLIAARRGKVLLVAITFSVQFQHITLPGYPSYWAWEALSLARRVPAGVPPKPLCFMS